MDKMKKWYQNVKGNKKIKIILTGIALLLVTISSTYAWWTASTTVNQEVKMGNLKIEASFKEKNHTNYEPGTYAEIGGTIKNTGSIPAMIKINNDSLITLAYSDDDLTPIPEANRSPEAIDGSVVKIKYEPQSGNYEDNTKVFWFSDTTGNKYLLMEPNSNVKIFINIEFDGPSMTNKYMDAVIDAKAQIKATQVMEGAIQTELGVDPNSLDSLPLTRARSTNTVSLAKARLQELLSRGN